MMRPVVRVLDDVAAYRAAVEPLLLRDEAAHGLMLGLLPRVEDGSYADPLLAVADRAGETVLAALRTPPHDLILSAADRPDADAAARRWLEAPEREVWLWEDGPEDGRAPVCMVGAGSPTRNGVRIGAVYTPPERRGRGYASALVAHVSASLLAAGRRFCTLYTDLDNPTSNRLYRRIGYRPVADVLHLRFEPDRSARPGAAP
jgi:predicted GNAT family acetyltransferase